MDNRSEHGERPCNDSGMTLPPSPFAVMDMCPAGKSYSAPRLTLDAHENQATVFFLLNCGLNSG